MSEQIAENDNNQTSKIKNGKSLGEIINDFPIVKNLRKSAPQKLGKYNFSPAIIAALKQRSEISDSISTNTIMSSQEEEFIKSSFGSLIEQTVEADINQHVPGLVITRGQINIEASLAEQKKLGIDPKEMGGVFLSYSRNISEEQKNEKVEPKEQKPIDYDEIKKERINDPELGDYFRGYYDYDEEMTFNISEEELLNSTIGFTEFHMGFDSESGVYYVLDDDEPSKEQSNDSEQLDNTDSPQNVQDNQPISLEDGASGILAMLKQGNVKTKRFLKALALFSKKSSPENDLLAKAFYWSRASKEERRKLREEDPQLDEYLKKSMSSENKEDFEQKLNIYAASQLQAKIDKIRYKFSIKNEHSNEDLLLLAVYSAEVYRLFKGFPEVQKQYLRDIRDASKELHKRGVIRREFIESNGEETKVLFDVIGEEAKTNNLFDTITNNKKDGKDNAIDYLRDGLSALRLNPNREKRGNKAYSGVIDAIESMIINQTQDRINEMKDSEKRQKNKEDNSIIAFDEISSVLYNTDSMSKDNAKDLETVTNNLSNIFIAHNLDSYYEIVKKYIELTGTLPTGLINDEMAMRNPKIAELFSGSAIDVQKRISNIYQNSNFNRFKLQTARFALDKLAVFGKEDLTNEGLANCLKFISTAIRDNSFRDEEKRLLIEVLSKLNPDLVNDKGKVNEEEYLRYYNDLLGEDDNERKPKTFRGIAIRATREVTDYYERNVKDKLDKILDAPMRLGVENANKTLERGLQAGAVYLYADTDLNFIEYQKQKKEQSTPKVSEENIKRFFQSQKTELCVVGSREELYGELSKADSTTVVMTGPESTKRVTDLRADLSKLSNKKMDKYIAKLDPQKLGEISVRINGIQPNTITTSGGFKVTGKAAEQFAESRKKKELMMGLSDAFNDKLDKQDETIHGFIASGATATAGYIKAGALIAKDKIKDKKEEKKSKAKAVEGKKREVEDEER